jgi:L-asparaginase
MAQIPELQAEGMPAYTIHQYDPLLDSANMSPHHWAKIAFDIRDHYDDYDGFIVIHGTDTMAYTASALAFMLQGLEKPVILTGSQIPLNEIRNDARDNIITSLMIASRYAIPEVCLYFGEKLLRGCRAEKVHANSLQAFDSPNFPPLGVAGIEIDIHWDLILPVNHLATPLRIQDIGEHTVAALRIFPGISAQFVANALRPPLKGLVIEAYGVGNAPAMNTEFLQVLHTATQAGIVIVDCSQCLYGSVALDSYATGSALAKVGVIGGFDMTVEAALVKLYYLFSLGYDSQIVCQKMQENLRGELTLE